MLLCQCFFMCGHHSIIYVLLFWTSQKDVWERERKWEVIPRASCRYHQERKEIKQENLAVARLLLPTSSLILPSTFYIWHWGAGLEVGNNTRPTTEEPLTVTAMEGKGKERNGNQDLCEPQQDAERTLHQILMKNFDEVCLLNILRQLRKFINQLYTFNGMEPGLLSLWTSTSWIILHCWTHWDKALVGQHCHPARLADGQPDGTRGRTTPRRRISSWSSCYTR